MRALIAPFVLVLICTACDPMNFKFVTSGENPDDAPIISRTIQGLALKPATPSDAKIFRDAQNNALVEWRRRGRINYHWRDRAGVPVSEESEYYEIEAYNGSNVANTYRVPLAVAQPIQWTLLQDDQSDSANFTIASDGSGTIYKTTSSAFLPAVLWGSKQLIQGDFIFEFQIYNDGSQTFNVPDLVNVRGAADPIHGLELAEWGNFGTVPTAYLVPGATHAGPNVPYATADRFVMSYKQGSIYFYKNPANDSWPVIYAASAAQNAAPYRVCFSGVHFPTALRNPTLLRFDTPDWTYTADMQTGDGLTPGNSIHLKIYQVSAITGRGLPLDVTL